MPCVRVCEEGKIDPVEIIVLVVTFNGVYLTGWL